MFANVHFRQRGTGGQATDEPYTADDFMGRGSRQARAASSMKDQMAISLANVALSKIKAGEPPPEIVPEWAIGEYHAV